MKTCALDEAKAEIDRLLSFSQSLGRHYSGEWRDARTLRIRISRAADAATSSARPQARRSWMRTARTHAHAHAHAHVHTTRTCMYHTGGSACGAAPRYTSQRLRAGGRYPAAVSYTHLTLPTILLV